VTGVIPFGHTQVGVPLDMEHIIGDVQVIVAHPVEAVVVEVVEMQVGAPLAEFIMAMPVGH
jgi:hypothetical protein